MQIKAVELWWRRVWIRTLVRLMRRASDSAPNWATGPRRILFLRHDRAGDMIVSTGVIRAIARSHPTISLDVLASPANASLLRHAPYVTNVIVFDKKRLGGYVSTALRLRRERYDAVIDCMVTAPSVTTLLLMLASGARHRIGIAGRGNDAAFNINVRDEPDTDAHMVDRIAALATAFGPALSADARRPVLDFADDEITRAQAVWSGGQPGFSVPRALINISAGTPDRLWPDEHYVAVMRHLKSRSPDVVLRVISSPSEAERAEAIARDGGGSAVRTPSLRDAVALVATADFVFTPDTSIAHAAAAARKPAVAFYRKGTRTRWELYDAPGESLEHTESNFSELPLEPVVRAVDAVWSDVVSQRR